MKKVFKILDKSYIQKLFETKKGLYFPSLKNKKILTITIKKKSPDWVKEACLAKYQITFSNSIKKIVWATAKIEESKKKAFEILNYLYKKGFNKGTFQVPRPLDYISDLNSLFYEEVKGKSLQLILEKKKLPPRVFEKLAEFLFRLHSLKLKKFKVTILRLKDYKECFSELKKIIPSYQKLFPPFEKINFLKKLEKGNHFLHGDFYPSNIIVDKKNISLIDFDKSGRGNFLNDLLSFYFWFELPKIKPLKMTWKEIEECRVRFLKKYCQLARLDFKKIKNELEKFKSKIFLNCLHYVTFRAVRGWKKIDPSLKNEFKRSLKTLLEKIIELV